MFAFGDVCREHQSSRLLLAQRVSRDVFLDREADSLVACVVRDFARDMRKEIEASGSFQVEDLASLYQRFRRRALNRLLSLRGSSAETLTRVHLTSVRMREEFAKLESAVEAIASLRIECLNSQLAHAYALAMQQQLNSGCSIPAGELQRLHRQQLHASLKALKAQAPAADTSRLMHRIKQLFSLMQRVNQETEGERESARQVMRSLSQAVDDRVHRVVKLAGVREPGGPECCCNGSSGSRRRSAALQLADRLVLQGECDHDAETDDRPRGSRWQRDWRRRRGAPDAGQRGDGGDGAQVEPGSLSHLPDDPSDGGTGTPARGRQ